MNEAFGLSHVITITIAVLTGIWVFVKKFFSLQSRVSVLETATEKHEDHLTKVEQRITHTLDRLEDKIDTYILKLYTDAKK